MTDRERRTVDGRVWLRLCRSAEVSARQGMHLELDIEHDLALFRVDGQVRIVSNVCPHKRASMIYDGFVENGCVTCPLHGWTFSLETGMPVIGAGRLRTYESIEMAGGVWIAEDALD